MDTLRHDYLAALGVQPLVLRDVPAAASSANESAEAVVVVASGSDADLFAPRPLRLQLHGHGLGDFSGAHGRLLRALVRAAGVAENEVGFGIDAQIAVIVFGSDDVADAAVKAPTPAQLRTAAAKRALWPALRRLRRALRLGTAP